MSGGGNRIRVLLVDDHALFREALAELLGLMPDIRVVGSVGDIPAAVEHLKTEIPDVILLDYDLGPELAFDLFARCPGIGQKCIVLILSAGVNTASTKRLFACGAAGVVWKHTGARELHKCIRKACAESRPLPPAPSPEVRTRLDSNALTQRQSYVARAVLHGAATKEIAAQLGVTDSSVKCTLQQLFAKTGTRSRAELVRILLERYPDQAVGNSRPVPDMSLADASMAQLGRAAATSG